MAYLRVRRELQLLLRQRKILACHEMPDPIPYLMECDMGRWRRSAEGVSGEEREREWVGRREEGGGKGRRRASESMRAREKEDTRWMQLRSLALPPLPPCPVPVPLSLPCSQPPPPRDKQPARWMPHPTLSELFWWDIGLF